MRGLVGLVFLFDLYTIYRYLLIHRIRRQLLEREELFHLISDNAADMIAVVDMNGKRIYNSLSYLRVLGYSPEELQTSSAFEQIHPDDRERVISAAAEARRSGIGKTLEYRLRHKNGDWLVLESTSSVRRDEKGEPEKLVIVNCYVSERKRAEEALRRSETGFKSVVEDAPYGIYRAGTAGRFLQVNPALQKMLGYELTAELFARDLPTEIFRHPGEYDRLVELLTRTEEIKDVEMEWNRKDSRPITVRCSGRRVDDENGVPAYFIVLTHHERYDGSGYPRGLKRDEILPSARIFAVADSFDAITSARPYRRASSFASGIQVIRGCSGTQFDPEVVNAFLSIPGETWLAIANDHSSRNLRSSAQIENKLNVCADLETSSKPLSSN